MWDLSSLPSDRTHVPYIGRQILNHWTTREAPWINFLIANETGFLLDNVSVSYQCWTELGPDEANPVWSILTNDPLGLVTQSCQTPCDFTDCSLPGSSAHGILQARILEWRAISFPGDLPDPRVEPSSPASQADSLPSETAGKPCQWLLRYGNIWTLEQAPNSNLRTKNKHKKSVSLVKEPPYVLAWYDSLDLD